MVSVHIEIPFGSNVKYEYENNVLQVDRLLSTAMVYPGNYGYIPKTLADDGDPIDVLVINTPALFPTSYIDCKVLGMLITEDEKGMDQKVIAVPNEKIDMNSKLYNDICDVGNVQLNTIHNFFSNYKANEKDKWVKVGDFKNAEETIKFIQSKSV
jgi:inorganic pyrophosphatase